MQHGRPSRRAADRGRPGVPDRPDPDRSLRPTTRRSAAIASDPGSPGTRLVPWSASSSGRRVLAVLLTLLAGGATAVAADKTSSPSPSTAGPRSSTPSPPTSPERSPRPASRSTPQDRVEPAPGHRAGRRRPRDPRSARGRSPSSRGRRSGGSGPPRRRSTRRCAASASRPQPIQMSAAPNTDDPARRTRRRAAGAAVGHVRRRHRRAASRSRPRPARSRALLAERGVTLGPDDVSVPSGDTPLDRRTWPCRWCATASARWSRSAGSRRPSRSSRTRSCRAASARSSRRAGRASRPWSCGCTCRTARRSAASRSGPEGRRRRSKRVVPARARTTTCRERAYAPSAGPGGVGRAGPLRGGRQLGDQHRQRLLRRPAVRPADLAGVRRRPVRAAAAPGQPRRADRGGVPGARRPRRLRRVAGLRPQAGAAA